MENREKIAILEDIMEIDEGTLRPDTILDELDEWDSITKLSLMIYFEEEVGSKLTSEEIKSFTTVKDICDRMD